MYSDELVDLCDGQLSESFPCSLWWQCIIPAGWRLPVAIDWFMLHTACYLSRCIYFIFYIVFFLLPMFPTTAVLLSSFAMFRLRLYSIFFDVSSFPANLPRCADWHCFYALLHCCSLNVLWNNTFIKIFNCCWRECPFSLQFYTGCLPMHLIIEQQMVLFYRRCLLYTSPSPRD